MVTMREVREQYPDPQSAEHHSGYCVMGAVMRTIQDVWWTSDNAKSFPSYSVSAEALMYLNPRLESDLAGTLATAIIRNNDAQRFDEAWNYLDLALNHGRGDVIVVPEPSPLPTWMERELVDA